MIQSDTKELSFNERIDLLRATKMRHTEEKWKELGCFDMDDLPIILPPAESRKIVRVVSGSGQLMVDALFKEFTAKTDHPSGGIFGARACGENFRQLIDLHPPYVDPVSSLSGAYMAHFLAYRQPAWNPDFDFSHLHEDQQRYKLHHGIGAVQHFCQDEAIGLTLGWGGILAKIRRYRTVNTDNEAQELYDGLEHMVLGIQNWITRHATLAREMATREERPQIRQNLEEIAKINEHLVQRPPQTFREACQWMLYYQLAGKMYNMGGSLGRIDQFLFPFYQEDKKHGILTDEEAIFHLACHFIMDTSYTQLGGPDATGKDTTNALSYLVLEAAHRLKVPVNVGVCVGKDVDPKLLRRGVEIMFEDKTGIPKFLGIDRTSEGFARNGLPIELGRQRAYSGCHWCAIPGREYTVNDCVKVNLAAVFEVAFNEMMADSSTEPSIDKLWQCFSSHIRRSVDTVAKSLDFHIDHMYRVFPELHLDLLCYGPIEKGRDASHGGVEFYNLCVDGAGLATVADSFAALGQRIEREKKITWQALAALLQTNWAGEQGERMRLMMKNIPRYGSGGSNADECGIRISKLFTEIVKEKPTPHGFNMIPGIFSWAATIAMGKDVGATPNGRYSQSPISHGPNPDPGFRKDAAPTALAEIVAAVQPGYGNTAPMQIELDPGLSKSSEDIDKVVALIRTHFDLGGTQINMNILNKKAILEAQKDPSSHPDLVVRVTGFSAYFASLSPEMRQIVVDRIIAEE
ncbi:MAG TPA: pyruvate formate lyase family protein [Bacteroidota bacterium]|nr:pyruvate formate lyase family protein [Bacteroidota bacterium]